MANISPRACSKTPHAVILPLVSLLLVFYWSSDIWQLVVHAVPVQYKTTTIGGFKYVEGVSPMYQAEYGPLSQPSAAIMNDKNETYISDTGNHVIRKITANGIITLFAGLGVGGYNGDDHILKCQFNQPMGLYLAVNGDLYVADSGNSMIRKISASTQMVTTIVSSTNLKNPMGVFVVESTGEIFVTDLNSGNGLVRKFDSTGTTMTIIAGGGSSVLNNVIATNTKLSSPRGIFVTPTGVIYITDTTEGLIRKITVEPNGQYRILTIAGMQGVSGGSFSEGTQPLNTYFQSPIGLYVTSSQDILVADAGFHRIRKISSDLKTVTTVAGNGTSDEDSIQYGNAGDYGPALSAPLNQPNFVSINSRGDLIITGLNRVRMVSGNDSTITTLAGKFKTNLGYGDGLKANSLGIRLTPRHAVLSRDGSEMYVSDSNSHTIRKLGLPNGIITTVAGVKGQSGFNEDGLLANQTTLSIPSGLYLYDNGELLIADSSNHRIRLLQLNGTITTIFSTNTSIGEPSMVVASGSKSTDGYIYFSTKSGIYKGLRSSANFIAVYTYSEFSDPNPTSFHVEQEQDGTVVYFGDVETASLVKYFEKNNTAVKLYTDPNLHTVASVFRRNGTTYFVLGSSRICKLLPDNSIQVIAGILPSNNVEFIGYSGEGLQANQSLLRSPNNLHVSPQGEIFFSERIGLVRKIGLDNTITTVLGFYPLPAPGTLANKFPIFQPGFVAINKNNGQIAIYSSHMTQDHSIFNVDGASGVISTLFGFRTMPAASTSFYEGPVGLSFIVNSQFCYTSKNNLIIATGYHQIVKVSNGMVSVVAGKFRTPSFSPDGTLANNTLMYNPRAVICVPSSQQGADDDIIYFDAGNRRIRMISNGVVKTIVGSGMDGDAKFTNDGVNATSVNIGNSVKALALSPEGDLYYSETSRHIVRVLNATTGLISTVAGIKDARGYYGENIAADLANLDSPHGLTIAPNGDLMIADSTNKIIRRVSKTTKLIRTIAGIPPRAQDCYYNGDLLGTDTCITALSSLAVNPTNGEIVFTDDGNGVVRKLTPFCEGNKTMDSTFSECSCPTGYGGNNCELSICNGTLSSNSGVCSGHGLCTSPGICVCFKGFTGTNCEKSTAIPVASSSSSRVPTDQNNTTTIIIAVVVPVAVVSLIGLIIAMLVIIVMCVVRKRGSKSDLEMNKPTSNVAFPNSSNVELPNSNPNSLISDFPSDMSVNFTPIMISEDRMQQSGVTSTESLVYQADPFSRYQNISRIGKGAFGSVYKANDTKFQNKVKAVKVMKFTSLSDLNNIMKEGMQLMNIRHDNILKVNDFFVSKDNLVCLDMDFYEQGDLAKFVTPQSPFCSEHLIKQIIWQVCNALTYVHGTLNIIHRDIKPSNIFIKSMKDDKIHVVLADFGLAKGNQGSEALSYAGTPLYMSPEIGLGGKYYANTDVYSLGVTIYQIMTKDSSTSISHLLLSKDPESVRKLLLSKMKDGEYSDELCDIVLKMLEKDSMTRPNAMDILGLPYFRNM
ncbi:hypothetical protein C9374_003153 [Naegleria lovaniensis]|uniref:Uncharacterized protein n=1 Tax=Naegleria lovaniensis TaxID=51637 RepID=A0AA88KLN7_NAELO|nr:uncharacterized protein C9374_003153 [Naegleria lovaniensis]KAG2386004.1 hypothetical protein C9374_003153 [Naegleria lovaniensis]